VDNDFLDQYLDLLVSPGGLVALTIGLFSALVFRAAGRIADRPVARFGARVLVTVPAVVCFVIISARFDGTAQSAVIVAGLSLFMTGTVASYAGIAGGGEAAVDLGQLVMAAGLLVVGLGAAAFTALDLTILGIGGMLLGVGWLAAVLRGEVAEKGGAGVGHAIVGLGALVFVTGFGIFLLRIAEVAETSRPVVIGLGVLGVGAAVVVGGGFLGIRGVFVKGETVVGVAAIAVAAGIALVLAGSLVYGVGAILVGVDSLPLVTAVVAYVVYAMSTIKMCIWCTRFGLWMIRGSGISPDVLWGDSVSALVKEMAKAAPPFWIPRKWSSR